MAGVSTTQLTLPCAPAAAARARHAVRVALRETGDADLRDAAELAVSELVTNAVVHAGTDVGLRIVANAASVRVEIEDGNVTLPVRCAWSQAAGTGRGLQIVEELVDRWDATRTEHGKVVWFEIGHLEIQPPPKAPVAGAISQTAEITLLNVPLGTHSAGLEHATTLLREYLLFTLDDDPYALDHHAAASGALTILRDRLHADPKLAIGADRSPATSNDTTGTPSEVVLQVPAGSVRLFEIFCDLLTRAVRAAQQGHLLGAPTQQEISKMREWLCGQIVGQGLGGHPPRCPSLLSPNWSLPRVRPRPSGAAGRTDVVASPPQPVPSAQLQSSARDGAEHPPVRADATTELTRAL